MRRLQSRILYLLNAVDVPPYIYGFERNRSIPAMAQIHCGKKAVISLDIKDYFPSISQYQVQRIFEGLGCATLPAKTLSELCTYKAFVPQGALTSPKISNIVAANTFGPEINDYCMANGLSLSIYADDVTMSYGFDKEFESREAEREFVDRTIRTVAETLAKYGFRLNREKTKVMRPHTRQWVCGAVVNTKVNMRKSDRAALRAIVHNCRNNGVVREAERSGLELGDFIRRTIGKLNWLAQLNPDKGKPLSRQFRDMARPLLRQLPDFEINRLAYQSIESVDEEETESSPVVAEAATREVPQLEPIPIGKESSESPPF